MSNTTITGYDPAAWRLSTFIGDWIYAVNGSRERGNHAQAVKRIRFLRNHLRDVPSPLRRDAIALYRIRKEQGNV